MNTNKLLKDILFGALIGDALGVPDEFRSRERMRMFPATSMIGQGSHNQPPEHILTTVHEPYVWLIH